MLLTSIGTELAVQGVLRMEENYLVLRGRMAGTTDSGRIFFVPYDQINYIGFIKPVKEKEIFAMYGEEGPPEKEEVSKTTSVTEPEAEHISAETSNFPADPPSQPDPPASSEATAAVETAPPQTEPRKASKSILLERLRARRASAAKPDNT